MTDPILVLTPDGRDAEVIGLVLAEVGLPVQLCDDLPALCERLAAGDATAVLLSEGVLSADMDRLLACIEAQPPWSDIPVLLLTARGPRTTNRARQEVFERLGNVTLLDRPMHAESLQSAATAAARARRRQYRTRSHLSQIADAARLLEQRVEERTRDLQAEIAERRRVEDTLRQAQKMEAVGQLTGGIAHDFNNLLQAISGSIELLQRRLGDGSTDVERFTRAAMLSVERAAALTQRLLAFARRQPLQPRRLDLNALVLGMEELVHRSVGLSVTVELRLADGLWHGWADGNQLENALLNLAINARDAMPDGGRLVIGTANEVVDAAAAAEADLPPGDYVALSVTDNGTGMTADVLERVFEPFFTTKPLGQGTGLGLSQIYGFARQSGGHVGIASAVGRGTTVTIRLPRQRQADESEEAPASETPPLPPSAGTILVLEDEALIRMVMVEALTTAGYRVIEAADGPGALALIESTASFDLLASDVGLPGMNGRQVAEQARRLRPGLKVLFITGYAHDTGIVEEMLGPDTRLLSKPVALDTLLATVGAMLGGDAEA